MSWTWTFSFFSPRQEQTLSTIESINNLSWPDSALFLFSSRSALRVKSLQLPSKKPWEISFYYGKRRLFKLNGNMLRIHECNRLKFRWVWRLWFRYILWKLRNIGWHCDLYLALIDLRGEEGEMERSKMKKWTEKSWNGFMCFFVFFRKILLELFKSSLKNILV